MGPLSLPQFPHFWHLPLAPAPLSPAPCPSQGVSKGRAVERLLTATMKAKGAPADFILCIGDDRWVGGGSRTL